MFFKEKKNILNKLKRLQMQKNKSCTVCELCVNKATCCSRLNEMDIPTNSQHEFYNVSARARYTYTVCTRIIVSDLFLSGKIEEEKR